MLESHVFFNQQMPGHMCFCSKSPMSSPPLWVSKVVQQGMPPFRIPSAVGTCLVAAWHWQELGCSRSTHCQHHFPHRQVWLFLRCVSWKSFNLRVLGFWVQLSFRKPQLTLALTRRETVFWMNGIHQASSVGEFEIMTSRPCRPEASDQVEPRVGLFLRQDMIEDRHVDLSFCDKSRSWYINQPEFHQFATILGVSASQHSPPLQVQGLVWWGLSGRGPKATSL